MPEEKNQKNWLTSTVLGDIPPTDPEYLRRMDNERLSQKHFAAVGKVASYWANLEVFVDYFAWKIAGMEERFAVCFTAQISGIARKLAAYTAIVRLQTGEIFIPRINKFSDIARILSERRNIIVHDPWIIDDGIPRRYEVSARKVLRQQMVYVSTSHLVLFYEEIDKTTDDLIIMSNEILAHVESLQQKRKRRNLSLERNNLQKDKIARLRRVPRRSSPP